MQDRVKIPVFLHYVNYQASIDYGLFNKGRAGHSKRHLHIRNAVIVELYAAHCGKIKFFSPVSSVEYKA